jgi:hypothetical protein
MLAPEPVDLKPAKAFVVHPGDTELPMKDAIKAIGLPEMMSSLWNHPSDP